MMAIPYCLWLETHPDLLGLALGLGQGRQQQRSQDAYDRNHHQQLNQGKSTYFVFRQKNEINAVKLTYMLYNKTMLHFLFFFDNQLGLVIKKVPVQEESETESDA